jgi:hypothetical protein
MIAARAAVCGEGSLALDPPGITLEIESFFTSLREG